MAEAAHGPVDSAPEPADFYGVPLFLMQSYLEQLGGRSVAPNLLAGDGWQARLEPAPWRTLGSLRVGGTRAHFAGEPDVLASLFARLHPMTQRAGG